MVVEADDGVGGEPTGGLALDLVGGEAGGSAVGPIPGDDGSDDVVAVKESGLLGDAGWAVEERVQLRGVGVAERDVSVAAGKP